MFTLSSTAIPQMLNRDNCDLMIGAGMVLAWSNIFPRAKMVVDLGRPYCFKRFIAKNTSTLKHVLIGQAIN